MSITRAAALPGIKGAYTAVKDIATITGALPIPAAATAPGATVTPREAALTTIREANTSIQSVAEPLGAIPKEVTKPSRSAMNVILGRPSPGSPSPTGERPTIIKRIVGEPIGPPSGGPTLGEQLFGRKKAGMSTAKPEDIPAPSGLGVTNTYLGTPARVVAPTAPNTGIMKPENISQMYRNIKSVKELTETIKEIPSTIKTITPEERARLNSMVADIKRRKLARSLPAIKQGSLSAVPPPPPPAPMKGGARTKTRRHRMKLRKTRRHA